MENLKEQRDGAGFSGSMEIESKSKTASKTSTNADQDEKLKSIKKRRSNSRTNFSFSRKSSRKEVALTINELVGEDMSASPEGSNFPFIKKSQENVGHAHDPQDTGDGIQVYKEPTRKVVRRRQNIISLVRRPSLPRAAKTRARLIMQKRTAAKRLNLSMARIVKRRSRSRRILRPRASRSSMATSPSTISFASVGDCSLCNHPNCARSREPCYSTHHSCCSKAH